MSRLSLLQIFVLFPIKPVVAKLWEAIFVTPKDLGDVGLLRLGFRSRNLFSRFSQVGRALFTDRGNKVVDARPPHGNDSLCALWKLHGPVVLNPPSAHDSPSKPALYV